MGKSNKDVFGIMEDVTRQTPLQQIKNCKIGQKTKLHHYINLYDCIIGENCTVGSFVEIQNGVTVGKNVKISSHSFLCEGVVIEENVFIGHHVVFTNDRYPRATNEHGTKKVAGEWALEKIIVRKGASIGSNSTILPGVIIGENAMIGAGSVVTKNVPANTTVAGVPADALPGKRKGEKSR
ncbi:MAG: hypothetical protein RLZZ455_422 [Candidatus Parcubacteria bacterium]